MAVLAAQEEPSAADIAGLFTGELIAILTRHHAHAPTAVSAACYALMCIIRSTAESASKYVRESDAAGGATPLSHCTASSCFCLLTPLHLRISVLPRPRPPLASWITSSRRASLTP